MPAAPPSPGTRIAHYEIVRLLGRGGMGEVYEARDTLLHRAVALKLLPEGFAQDSARAGRFQREARTLAALTHPNIATLYSFEPGPARACLVVELVAGETLAKRLARGPIPVPEALELARQIASALEAAHEHGIIHRDIKPANIQITPEGQAKVLDFGLARAGLAADPSEAVTVPDPATESGAILGTPAYMAPEQARGQATDARTDVFAFGCLLYEMLSGRRAFAAPTSGDALAAVLTAEPDFASLSPHLPPRLLALLRRALAKSPRERWQAMGDLRYEIEYLQHDSGAATVTAARPPFARRAAPVIAAAVIAGAIAVFFSLRLRPKSASPMPVQFSFDVPAAGGGGAALKPIAISPDGSAVALATLQVLYLRRMGQEAPQTVFQAMGLRSPAFSPDGRWIASWSNATGELQKIEIGAGLPVTLASVAQPSGISWSNNGEILLGGGGTGNVLEVPAAGGLPRTLLSTEAQGLNCCPQLLPDGKHVLLTIFPPPFSASTAQIVVEPLQGGPAQVVVNSAFDARYIGSATSGAVFYAVGSTLMRASFDPATLQLGSPQPVLQGMAWAAGISSAHADYAVAENGALAWISGSGRNPDTSVALITPTGQHKLLTLPAGLYVDAVASPDGRELAIQSAVAGGNYAVNVVPIAGGSLRRLTFAGSSGMPIWSPDGRYVAFESTEPGNREGLWVQRADGSRPARNLSYAPGDEVTAPDSWSPDGRTILFSRHLASLGVGVWSIPAAGGKPKLLVRGRPHAGSATFSPDGHWFAYFSDQSGRSEIWVQPFPPTGARYEVSYGGGAYPRWSSDGRLLYYLAPDDGMPRVLTEVSVQFTPSFSAAPPHALPGISTGWMTLGERVFDVLPGGAGFVGAVTNAARAGAFGSTRIHVLLHSLSVPR
ncbi:MAG: protein kinase domain-containing protein [Terriglobales bacterium]